MASLTSLVYMSVAVDDLTDAQLVDMLREARLRNDALGVSGLLLAKGGRFMQVLEGPSWSVEDRYAAIERDPRHRDVQSLSREAIESRRFDGWAMAFGSPSDVDVLEEPGFSGFLQRREALPGTLAGTSADFLLRWFRARDLQDGQEERITLGRHAA